MCNNKGNVCFFNNKYPVTIKTRTTQNIYSILPIEKLAFINEQNQLPISFGHVE